MKKFAIVSFCNNPSASASPLLCIKISKDNTLSNEFAPINLGFPGTSTHATGLTSSDELIFIAFHSEGIFYISVLARNNLLPVFQQPLPEAKDIHSLLVWGKSLYVVSTGTDQVLSYDILSHGLTNPTVVWQASKENRDTHHINSIALHNNELFISAFGPKTGSLWSSAQNGYIHNINRDSRLKENIFHPHSLSANNEKLYYCESHKGSFCSLNGEIFTLPGYTRGVSWLSPTQICIATSIGRKVSRSTGMVGNPGDPGEVHGLCGITIRDINDKENTSSLDLSWFGPETYDVLLLESPSIDLQKMAINSYISERIIVNETKKILENLSSLHAERDAQLAERDTQLADIYTSKVWKFGLWVRKIRVLIAPPGSIQANISNKILAMTKWTVKKIR